MKVSMAIIPQDIITTHILHRLPPKSVGRFRCVSKEWLFLLTQPQFIQTHQKTHNTNRFIIKSDDGSLYSVPYYNHQRLTKLRLKELHNLNIHGSVSGLVFASTYKNLNAKDYTDLLLNLTTKDYVELPIASENMSFGMKGFGYDSVSDDYKVVKFSFFEEYFGNVYVYKLRTNKWKHVTYSSYRPIMSRKWWSGVFVNGFLHWIAYDESKLVIVAFGLADEKLNELSLPNELDIECDLELDELFLPNELDINLVALGEKQLAIFNKERGDVWLMNEYGVHTSWTKIICGFNQIPMYKPIVFGDNGKVLFLTSDLLWIYDVEERIFYKSVDVSYMKIGSYVGACAESLVSPKFSTSKSKSSNSMEEDNCEELKMKFIK